MENATCRQTWALLPPGSAPPQAATAAAIGATAEIAGIVEIGAQVETVIDAQVEIIGVAEIAEAVETAVAGRIMAVHVGLDSR